MSFFSAKASQKKLETFVLAICSLTRSLQSTGKRGFQMWTDRHVTDTVTYRLNCHKVKTALAAWAHCCAKIWQFDGFFRIFHKNLRCFVAKWHPIYTFFLGWKRIDVLLQNVYQHLCHFKITHTTLFHIVKNIPQKMCAFGKFKKK